MNESWYQIITLFIANAGIILWFRTESRNDWHKIDTELKQFRKETSDEMKEFRKIMFDEIKDFHGRLCTIEERRLAIEKK